LCSRKQKHWSIHRVVTLHEKCKKLKKIKAIELCKVPEAYKYSEQVIGRTIDGLEFPEYTDSPHLS
jgi:hypothetical protein